MPSSYRVIEKEITRGKRTSEREQECLSLSRVYEEGVMQKFVVNHMKRDWHNQYNGGRDSGAIIVLSFRI